MKSGSKQNTMKSPPAPFFGALDGFRGLLAIFVAIYHTYWPSKTNGSAFLEHGPVIIDLFFVFSGFLLFTLYEKRISTPKQGTQFLKKRFARLYPLHLFMLFLFLMFACLRVGLHAAGLSSLDQGEILPFQPGAQERVSTLVSNLTLVHSMGLHESLSYNVPSWTISVEFFAYFTFVGLLIWAPLKKAWHFILLAFGIAGLYGFLSLLKPDMNITYDFGFFRCLAGFYTGVITAKIYAGLKDNNTIKAVGFKLASFIEICVVLVSTAFVIYCPGKLQFFVAPILLMFVLVFAFDRGVVSKLMMTRLFRYLAKISYSVYMVHMIVAVVFYAVASKLVAYEWFKTGINGDLFLIPYLACVFVLSHFTQKYVEVKGMKYVMSLSFGGVKSKKEVLSKS